MHACRFASRNTLVALILLGSLILAACDSSGSGPAPTTAQTATTTSSPTAAGLPVGATLLLDRSSFAQTGITLSAGQALHIVDPGTTGGDHVLCLGTDGHCDAAAQGPDLLHSPGLALHPGDTKDIPFPSAGSYQVTCTIHPGMHLTISVLGVG